MRLLLTSFRLQLCFGVVAVIECWRCERVAA
jgi:hypothetical protein